FSDKSPGLHPWMFFQLVDVNSAEKPPEFFGCDQSIRGVFLGWPEEPVRFESFVPLGIARFVPVQNPHHPAVAIGENKNPRALPGVNERSRDFAAHPGKPLSEIDWVDANQDFTDGCGVQKHQRTSPRIRVTGSTPRRF